MVFWGHFWSLTGQFCLNIAKYNMAGFGPETHPIWAKFKATRVHWNWQKTKNTWDMPGLKVETRFSQILLSNLPGAISRVFLNIFWHFLCLNLSTFHGEATSWLSYPSACHWMAPMKQKGRQAKKSEIFKNFQILPPKWVDSPIAGKKNCIKFFSIYYVTMYWFWLLDFLRLAKKCPPTMT